MKIFKYKIGIIDSDDKEYYKTGIIISDNTKDAKQKVYEHYENKTMDYVNYNVLLNEISINENTITEDEKYFA